MYGRKSAGGSGAGSGGGGGAGVPAGRPSYPKPASPRGDNELCSDPKIDAMFNTADGNTYAFKGDNYYRLTQDTVAEGYPKPISEGWPGLPGTIII